MHKWLLGVDTSNVVLAITLQKPTSVACVHKHENKKNRKVFICWALKNTNRRKRSVAVGKY